MQTLSGVHQPSPMLCLRMEDCFAGNIKETDGFWQCCEKYSKNAVIIQPGLLQPNPQHLSSI